MGDISRQLPSPKSVSMDTYSKPPGLLSRETTLEPWKVPRSECDVVSQEYIGSVNGSDAERKPDAFSPAAKSVLRSKDVQKFVILAMKGSTFYVIHILFMVHCRQDIFEYAKSVGPSLLIQR